MEKLYQRARLTAKKQKISYDTACKTVDDLIAAVKEAKNRVVKAKESKVSSDNKKWKNTVSEPSSSSSAVPPPPVKQQVVEEIGVKHEEQLNRIEDNSSSISWKEKYETAAEEAEKVKESQTPKVEGVGEVLADLRAKVKSMNVVKTLFKAHKNSFVELSKLKEDAENKFSKDIEKTVYQEFVEEKLMCKMIALHFLHNGRFELYDTFNKETRVTWLARSLKKDAKMELSEEASASAPIVSPEIVAAYKRLHEIKVALENFDLSPAIEWFELKSTVFKNSKAHLIFQLHKFKLYAKFSGGARSCEEAWKYCQEHILPFKETMPEEVNEVITSIIFLDDVNSSPYSKGFTEASWKQLIQRLTKLFCETGIFIEVNSSNEVLSNQNNERLTADEVIKSLESDPSLLCSIAPHENLHTTPSEEDKDMVCQPEPSEDTPEKSKNNFPKTFEAGRETLLCPLPVFNNRTFSIYKAQPTALFHAEHAYKLTTGKLGYNRVSEAPIIFTRKKRSFDRATEETADSSSESTKYSTDDDSNNEMIKSEYESILQRGWLSLLHAEKPVIPSFMKLPPLCAFGAVDTPKIMEGDEISKPEVKKQKPPSGGGNRPFSKFSSARKSSRHSEGQLAAAALRSEAGISAAHRPPAITYREATLPSALPSTIVPVLRAQRAMRTQPAIVTRDFSDGSSSLSALTPSATSPTTSSQNITELSSVSLSSANPILALEASSVGSESPSSRNSNRSIRSNMENSDELTIWHQGMAELRQCSLLMAEECRQLLASGRESEELAVADSAAIGDESPTEIVSGVFPYERWVVTAQQFAGEATDGAAFSEGTSPAVETHYITLQPLQDASARRELVPLTEALIQSSSQEMAILSNSGSQFSLEASQGAPADSFGLIVDCPPRVRVGEVVSTSEIETAGIEAPAEETSGSSRSVVLQPAPTLGRSSSFTHTHISSAEDSLKESKQLTDCVAVEDLAESLAVSSASPKFDEEILLSSTPINKAKPKFVKYKEVKLPSESPLAVVISAGLVALPRILYVLQAYNKGGLNLQDIEVNGSSRQNLPLELDLGPRFHFHSSLICAVSREVTHSGNPPIRLSCGHIVCEACFTRLSKRSSLERYIKCPMCPMKISKSEVQPIIMA